MPCNFVWYGIVVFKLAKINPYISGSVVLVLRDIFLQFRLQGKVVMKIDITFIPTQVQHMLSSNVYHFEQSFREIIILILSFSHSTGTMTHFYINWFPTGIFLYVIMILSYFFVETTPSIKYFLQKDLFISAKIVWLVRKIKLGNKKQDIGKKLPS